MLSCKCPRLLSAMDRALPFWLNSYIYIYLYTSPGSLCLVPLVRQHGTGVDNSTLGWRRFGQEIAAVDSDIAAKGLEIRSMKAQGKPKSAWQAEESWLRFL